MAKPITPLLSFEAQGTLDHSLTFSKSGTQTVAKSIPSHPDARSYNQVLQRWSFKDANHWYNSLTPAQRETYSVGADRSKRTVQQNCLKYYLVHLPDLALHYRMDSGEGAVCQDHSKNANNGTPYGTTLVDGLFQKARLFDALDDYVDCGSGASLNITTAITLELWIKSTLTWDHAYGVSRIFYKYPAYLISLQKSGIVTFSISDGGVEYSVALPEGHYLLPNLWAHLAATYDGSNLRIYKDSQLAATTPHIGDIDPAPSVPLFLGTDPAGRYAPLTAEEVHIYNRATSAAQVAEHHRRRFNPPASYS